MHLLQERLRCTLGINPAPDPPDSLLAHAILGDDVKREDILRYQPYLQSLAPTSPERLREMDLLDETPKDLMRICLGQGREVPIRAEVLHRYR